MTDEREWLGHLPLIEAHNNTTNNLPTTITDNSTIIIADECVSEVDKHNITNNVPATTVNNTIIMTDEREWLGHLPLIEAPNPVHQKIYFMKALSTTLFEVDIIQKHRINNFIRISTTTGVYVKARTLSDQLSIAIIQLRPIFDGTRPITIPHYDPRD